MCIRDSCNTKEKCDTIIEHIKDSPEERDDLSNRHRKYQYSFRLFRSGEADFQREDIQQPSSHRSGTVSYTHLIDTRGHGKSPRGEKPFTIEQFAQDLKDFMTEKKIGKAKLLGFSDGGNIALAFALKYQQMICLLYTSRCV